MSDMDYEAVATMPSRQLAEMYAEYKHLKESYGGKVYREQQERIATLEAENYSDLMDQMDEAWGSAHSIGRNEIEAFILSRSVHRPTTKLRERIAELEALIDAAIQHRDYGNKQTWDELDRAIKAIQTPEDNNG